MKMKTINKKKNKIYEKIKFIKFKKKINKINKKMINSYKKLNT